MNLYWKTVSRTWDKLKPAQTTQLQFLPACATVCILGNLWETFRWEGGIWHAWARRPQRTPGNPFPSDRELNFWANCIEC